MQLPRITHLQFLVLGILLDGAHTGREVRATLGENGLRKSGPAFYQLMARLEDAKFVTGSYDQQVIDGQIIKQRRYKVTSHGARAWRASRDFYLRAIREFEPNEGLTGA